MCEPGWWEEWAPALMALKDAQTLLRASVWIRFARAVGRRTAAQDCPNDTAPPRTAGLAPTFSCFWASRDRSAAPDRDGCPQSRSASAAAPGWPSCYVEEFRAGGEQKKGAHGAPFFKP